MKKSLLIIYSLLYCCFAIAQTNSKKNNWPDLNGNHKALPDMYGKSMRTTGMIPKFDSALHYIWNTPTNTWATPPLERLGNITYDAGNNMTGYTSLDWDGSMYVNGSKFTATYSGHNQTSQTDQNWNGSAWENYSKYTYTYDIHNNLLVESYFEWNVSSWEEYRRETYTYDANSNMLTDEVMAHYSSSLVNDSKYTYTYFNNMKATATRQQWGVSSYVNDWYETYSYDVNNNLTGIIHQKWFGSSFENYTRTTNTYAGNKILTSLVENWDGYSSSYINASRTTNTYNGSGDLTISLSEMYDGTNFTNSYRSLNTYDGSHHQTGALNQFWSISFSAFINAFQMLASFDSYGIVKGISYKYFDVNGNNVTSGDSLQYFFQAVAGLNEFANGGIITIFPNPASAEIRIQHPESGIEQIEIYNAVGQLFNQCAIHHSQSDIALDVSTLKPGLYFLRMRAGDEMIVRKFIKE